jgi:hypothetical protein
MNLLDCGIGLLPKTNLRGAILHEADLRGVDLHGANLREAHLCKTNLRRTNLHGANLHEADLRGAILYGADLREANLHGATLYGANLREADLYGANLYGANLCEANLHETKGIKYILFDDVRGYILYTYYCKELRFKAGRCKDFSYDEALAHWGHEDYENLQRGQMYIKAVKLLKELWSMDKKEK